MIRTVIPLNSGSESLMAPGKISRIRFSNMNSIAAPV